MDIRPIHTEADYKATLKEISALMESDPDLGTPEGDRLDILATLVQAYEAKHVPSLRLIRWKPSNSGWIRAACPSKILSRSSARATAFMKF